MSLPASLDPLRERPFQLLFLGQALSRLGSSLVPVALAFAAYQVSGSASGVGLVLMASRLPQVAFVLVGGVLADRLPRNALMLASDLVRAAAQTATAILLATGHATIALLVVLQLVHGAALAFFDPAMTGLVPQTVSPPRLQRANALLGLTGSSMAVLGQVLVGVIVAFSGVSLAFALDAATYLASAASLAFLRVPAPPRRAAARFGQAFRGGFAEFRARTWLWVGSLHIALLNAFAIAPFFVLGPVVSARALGGAGAWAGVATAYALGLVCGGALALRWRPSRPVFTALAVIVLAAPQLALLALEAPVPLVIAAGFLGGAETADLRRLLDDRPAAARARRSRVSHGGLVVAARAGAGAAGTRARGRRERRLRHVGGAGVRRRLHRAQHARGAGHSRDPGRAGRARRGRSAAVEGRSPSRPGRRVTSAG